MVLAASLEAGRHRAGYDSLIFMDEIVVDAAINKVDTGGWKK
jgi:hypothetical protein